MKVYSVFDSKVGAYLEPKFYRANGEAIRAFQSAIEDPSNFISKHAADFTLFELGEWDENTASFTLLATPKSLGVAIEFLSERHVSPDLMKKVVGE